MEDIYLVQCINCKHRDFIQEYEGGDLVCTTCGNIGMVEDVPNIDQEIEALTQSIQVVQVRPTQSMEELQMIERSKKLNNKPRTLEQMMAESRIRPQKRPTIRR